jgi:capsid protein
VLQTAAWLDAMQAAHGGRRSAFGYDAVNSRGKRREATGVLRSEEQELPGVARRKLTSQSRDVVRNFVIAGWMIRRHLDYVTTFRFQGRTASGDLNKRIEDLVQRQSVAERCDVAHRHPFRRFLRIAEARRCVDGDVGILKLKSGHLQGIEGDRIRSLAGSGASAYARAQEWFDYGHGVKLDRYNRATGYSVCSRVFGGGFRFERIVPAQNMYLHGFFDRFDQVRGVSPVSAAINTFCDAYEGIDYALAKSKVAQLFALAITRKSDNTMGDVAVTSEDGTTSGPRYDIDFGKGPVKLELENGDEAEFLENNTPATEFQDFMTLVVAIALKSLDIPFSFYDEAYTTYSGARQALLQYEAAAAIKREDVRALLDHIFAWWARRWERLGWLPKSVRAEDLLWEWVHAGLPWLDPLNEIQANTIAISAGLDTRTNILAQQGRDFKDVARGLAEETAFLQALGLPADVQPVHALIPKVASGDPQQQPAKQSRKWLSSFRRIFA